MIEYFDSLDELKIVLECMNSQNKEVKIQDLYDFISDNGRLNETVSRDIFKQLIKIVHDITSVGIMHGDIKDENILIDPQNLQIKLIDFGAGTVLHNDIYRYYNGTIVYAPPEWFIRGEYRAEGLNTGAGPSYERPSNVHVLTGDLLPGHLLTGDFARTF